MTERCRACGHKELHTLTNCWLNQLQSFSYAHWILREKYKELEKENSILNVQIAQWEDQCAAKEKP